MKSINWNPIRSAFTCLILYLTGFITLHAQSETGIDIAQQAITIRLKQQTLKTFVDKISSQTGYTFIYGETVELTQLIDINAKKQPLQAVFRSVFNQHNISFRIVKSHIILTNKPEAARMVTVSGYVTDLVSHESLIGANVYDPMQRQGTTSNAYGFYSLTLPVGKSTLQTSYIGYVTKKHSLSLTNDTVINTSLRQDLQLEEVTVLADRPDVGIFSTQTGSLDVPLFHIRNTPTLMGEPDVLKSLQLLPGVQSGTEGTAGIHVRGGGPDQNLFLLDGVPLYNVDHLLGLFSVFTPEAVKKVTLYKGGFPARFGGRLSSVVDVRTKDGDKENCHGSVSVGLISSKLNFEGPIVKEKTSFNFSARRSYLDLIVKPFLPKDEKMGYYFYDTNMKINHIFNDRSRLYLSAYHGRDVQDYDYNDSYKHQGGVDFNINKYNTQMDWGSTVVAARWNYVFSNKLFSNQTVAYNNYRFELNTSSENIRKGDNIEYRDFYESIFHSGIKDWSYNLDFEYNPHPNHRIKFGAGYLYHTFRPEVNTSRVQQEDEFEKLDTLVNHATNQHIYAHEASVYAEDQFEVGTNLSINAGVHLSLFLVEGASYFSAQPRLSMRYELPKSFALKASYSKMNQYTHLLSSSAISMPTDLWVPVTKNIMPMRAHQYALGLYNTAIKGWEFSVEGYYKSLHNVLEYKDGISFFGSSANWQEKVEMGKGRSFGVEFLAQRTIGNTMGWIGYTLAKSDRQFSKGGINGGERFPYKYDRRHNASLTVSHKFSKRIDLSASWVFSSGDRTTLAQEETVVIRPDGGWYGGGVRPEELIESRNNYTLPASHRLNIGVNIHKKLKRGSRTWNVSIYNAYNAMNPNFVHWGTVRENGKDRRVLKKLSILPCIPSFSYTYRF